MKKVIFLCFGFFGGCFAWGRELVADNFESTEYTVGCTVPNGTYGWTNLLTSSAQGWKIAATNSSFTIIPGGTSLFADTQALHFVDTDTTGLANASIQNIFSRSVTEHAKVGFDFCVKATAQSPTFFLRNSAGNIGVQVTLCSTDRRIQYRDATTTVSLTPANFVILDTWYRIEITVADVTVPSDTFSIRLLKEDGGTGMQVTNWTGLAFRNDISSLDKIEFGSNGASGASGADFYLDNVEVIPYQNPITITSSGTYSGNYWSSNPAGYAILVDCPGGNVVIEDCNVGGVGSALIKINDPAPARVVIRNCKGTAEFSTTSTNKMPRFLKANDPRTLCISNNLIMRTRGMNIQGISPSYTTNDEVSVKKNICVNLDGRCSNGNGNPAYPAEDSKSGCFFQLQDVTNLCNCVIEWNLIYNEPYKCHASDAISVYRSNGRPDSRICIQNNYLEGSYHGDAFGTSVVYAATGINTGDGDPGTNSNLNPGWVLCSSNQCLNTGHAGIAISSGHDIEVSHNRVWSNSMVGTNYYNYSWGGIYLVNYYNLTNSLYYNHSVHDNQSSWVWARYLVSGWWWSTHHYINLPPDSEANEVIDVGGTDERNPDHMQVEQAIWTNKLRDMGIFLGPDW